MTKEFDPTKYPPTGAETEKVSEVQMAELQNPKHELFCQEYVKDGNGARAYRAV